jgi:hypothetical protein
MALAEKVEEKYAETERVNENIYGEVGMRPGNSRRREDRDAFRAEHLEDDRIMIRFLEEVHQMKGAQSTPRALMDQWFKSRPDRDTSTIYVLTVYSLTGRPTERQVLAVSRYQRCGPYSYNFPIGFL